MSAGVARRAGAGWFSLFTLAWLAIWTAQLTPVQLLLPLQLDSPDDASGWIAGVVYSGLVLGIGGVVAIVVLPVAGALSDRTRGRWGRRRPWAVGGSLLAAASLITLAFATPLGVGVGWIGVSVGLAVASA
ncbi:MFS transporter, partial [Microbacterium sp. CPCC 204701]|uniref:MFS transporter n=1 Tax=Microbacterium sp. CPCC 204701 TaxID=2493084 RepID=UPI00197B3316